jgi:hypothetical protein
MPNTQPTRSLLARTLRQLGEHCVWWLRMSSALGQEPLGQELSQTGDFCTTPRTGALAGFGEVKRHRDLG